jgi:hypothetical protein
MNPGTWGRSVQMSDRLGVQRKAVPPARERDEDDIQLEQWHESQLGNLSYLAIFMLVSLFTLIAFVPVWLILKAQRAAGLLRTGWSSLRHRAQRT